MKIGIILHPYDEDKPAGLARSIFGFTKGMLEVDKENEYIIFLKNSPRKKPDLPGKNWGVEALGGGRFWLERLRYATKVDVCVFNTPVMPLFYKPKRSVIIALDFAYWYLAGKNIKSQLLCFFTFVYHFISLKRADNIVSISEATKKDLIKLFKTPEKKIKVIYLGFKKICDISEERVDLPERFFFFVGTLKERKNVLNIIKAFSVFKKNNPDKSHKLIIAGKYNKQSDYIKKIFAFIGKNKLQNEIIFLEHITDAQLSFLYKKAEALLFPSQLEGFGLPVLEAMDCGVPVITSNQSSLPEVGGEAAILVDPYDINDIARAIERVATDDNLRQQLIAKGYIQAKKFSWEKAAKELLQVVSL